MSVLNPLYPRHKWCSQALGANITGQRWALSSQWGRRSSPWCTPGSMSLTPRRCWASEPYKKYLQLLIKRRQAGTELVQAQLLAQIRLALFASCSDISGGLTCLLELSLAKVPNSTIYYPLAPNITQFYPIVPNRAQYKYHISPFLIFRGVPHPQKNPKK